MLPSYKHHCVIKPISNRILYICVQSFHRYCRHDLRFGLLDSCTISCFRHHVQDESIGQVFLILKSYGINEQAFPLLSWISNLYTKNSVSRPLLCSFSLANVAIVYRHSICQLPARSAARLCLSRYMHMMLSTHVRYVPVSTLNSWTARIPHSSANWIAQLPYARTYYVIICDLPSGVSSYTCQGHCGIVVDGSI